MASDRNCGMVPVNGVIVAVGPVTTGDGDTTFQYLAIQEPGGRPRHFTIVRALTEIAALIEPQVIGFFLIWEQPGERRLCFVHRADGPRRVDYEAVRDYFDRRLL